MKHICSLSGCRLKGLLLIFSFCSLSVVSFAQFLPDTTSGIDQWWFHSLTATSRNYPSSLTQTIYDDWKFPQTAGGGTTIYYFNCQRNYLFSGYTVPDDSIDFTINTNTASAYSDLDVYMYRDRSDLGLPPLLISTYTHIHPTGTFSFGDTTQGLYVACVVKSGDDPLTDTVIIKGYLPLIKKVQKIWIEATPICAGPYASGTYYHFQVKSQPAINRIIGRPTNLGYLNLTPVTSWPADPSDITCDNTFLPWDIKLHFEVNDVSSIANVTNHTYSILNDFMLNNKTDSNVSDYYINYDYLNIWLVTYPGSSYGLAPNIHIRYTDGILDDISADAPLIINTPVSDIPPSSSSPTAVPPTGIVGPPHAIGIPWASFHAYDYIVSGTETWTPTSNPFATMQGGGTVSTVRIQHQLKIPAGTTLNLVGMRLEFGPNGEVLTDCASSPSGSGGYIYASASTVLTAYRGCYGLEQSTWKGISLRGNPSWPIPFVSGTMYFAAMPHGKIEMINSTISYANIGLRAGTDLGEGGGGIRVYSSHFLNNKTMVKINPYHNIISGLEFAGMRIMNTTDFVYDNSAWFGVTNFIDAQAIKGLSMSGSTLLNDRSGSTVQAGINAVDVSMDISGCTFTKFKVGISDASVMGTRASTLIGNTFTLNNKGIMVLGGIAPKVVSNTFNIPRYTGSSIGYYPFTSVRVLTDQNIGALMMATTAYNIYDNTFASYAPISPLTYNPDISGTIEYNTGSDPNQVIKNTFSGVGVAMNSNFTNKNATATKGLRYLCNTTQNTAYDIAVCGNVTLDGGIPYAQATTLLTGWASAGNIFSTGWNLYNQQTAFAYAYKTTPENPVNHYGPVTITALPYAANCIIPYGYGPHSSYTTVGSSSTSSYTAGAANEASLRYTMASANVNAYFRKATDSTDNPHRDSLYFWASEMNTAYGDLLTACLLIEDSLIDSANTVYDSIVTKYALDSPEVVDFIYGRDLMDILIDKRADGNDLMTLTSAQVATLETVRANTKMWAHARAGVWLNVFRGDTLDDTLLYPEVPDSVQLEEQQGGRPGNANNKGNATASHIIVYPNPATSMLYFEFPLSGEVTIKITDVTGRIIDQQIISNATKAVFNVKAYSPGVYMYQVITNGKTQTGKVLIRN